MSATDTPALEMVPVPAERGPLVPPGPAYMPVMNLQQAARRREELEEFISNFLVPDVDYGSVPGSDRNVLLKPGAEKLCSFFGLSVKLELMDKVEDWTGKDHGGEPFFYYRYKVALYRGEQFLGEGEGSCNSFESKYRYRWCAKHDIPEWVNRERLKTKGGPRAEPDFAINKAETTGPYGKPAEYWKQYADAIETGAAKQITRKTKAGKDMVCWEIDQTLYRIPNEDAADLVNTLQKMAQKRALIAPVLVVLGLSERFTQDIEDADEHPGRPPEPEPQRPPSATVTPAPQKVEAPAPTGQDKPTPKSEAHALYLEMSKVCGFVKADQEDILDFLRNYLGSDDLGKMDDFSKGEKFKQVISTEKAKAGSGAKWVRDIAAQYRKIKAGLAPTPPPPPPPQDAKPHAPAAAAGPKGEPDLMTRHVRLCRAAGDPDGMRLMNRYLDKEMGHHNVTTITAPEELKRFASVFTVLEKMTPKELREFLLDERPSQASQPADGITDDDVPF